MSESPADKITPEALRARIEAGACVLVDVREADEYARERIAQAHHAPLSRMRIEDIPALEEGREMVVYCASGARSQEALERLRALGIDEAVQLHGGLGAWKAAGLDTVFDPRVPISVMRQVQIVAGSLVLLGVVLGATVSPWLYGLSAFVGAGLVFAGVSGICAMASLLQVMPWNRRHAGRQGPGVGAAPA